MKYRLSVLCQAMGRTTYNVKEFNTEEEFEEELSKTHGHIFCYYTFEVIDENGKHISFYHSSNTARINREANGSREMASNS